ncbi:nuclear mRNA export, poly(A)+RNA binding protein [Puccinia graminis f. sp. tritici]|uniref:Nuclear mRNA export, poly(A)+RNA binding protein n=1 Tax=Puccinia graminis f. sp. tritici TaxID=56615 RepID=A0A5B0LUI4_PUCGR|nr:nuclear mRNA export, poly(A)+RNA binding protein [Puccinia graminis f. sp. tritici]
MAKPLDTLPPQPPLPMSIQPAFMNDSSTSTFVAAFCLQFFNTFNHDCTSLMDVYATQYSFSLCASPYIPARAKMAGLTRFRLICTGAFLTQIFLHFLLLL